MRRKDIFDFKLVDDFSGYNSASDKGKLPPGMLIRGSKNCYKKVTGTIASRPGIKRRGSIDSTNAGVKSSYEWSTSLNTFRALRVANGKLEVESDVAVAGTYVWYELLETDSLASLASSLTRFVFTTWYDSIESKDTLVFVRGDDKIFWWSGGIAALSSATLFSSSGAVISATPTAAGSGYIVGEVLLLSTGDGNARVRVDSLSGSGVASVSLLYPGAGYTTGAGTATTSISGSGSGCTINITALQSVYTLIKTGTETWAEAGFIIADEDNSDTTDPTGQARHVILNNAKRLVLGGAEYIYSSSDDLASTSLRVWDGGDPTSSPANSAVIQSVAVQDNAPADEFACDFLLTNKNRVYYGSYTSPVIYASSDIDFLDFTNSGSHVPGDPETIKLDSLAKGIGEQNDQVVIFGGQSEIYLISPDTPLTITYNDPGDGGARAVYMKVDKKQVPGLSAALGHEFIGNISGYLVWLDQKNQLRALGNFTNEAFQRPTLLSLPVQQELSEDDFTGGHLRVVEDTVYITAPNNGRDWMYTIREKLNEDGSVSSEKIWQPPQIRGFSRLAIIDGVLYGHSNVNPQIYQLWDTEQWFDDHPSDEEIPYTVAMRLAMQNHDRPQGMLKFDGIYVEGYMAEGFDLKCTLFYDYQGSTGTRDLSVSNDTSLAEFYTGYVASSFGDGEHGANPHGDGILEEANDQELVPKFKAIINIPQPKNCTEYNLEFYSTAADSRWEILRFGTNVKLARQNATKLKK
jgi:hypothetical protein